MTQHFLVKFADVIHLSTSRTADPLAAGIERYVGLEHIEPENLHIRSWGLVADGTTFTSTFKRGQVLFGKRRAYQRKVAVADFDGVCSSDIYVFESKDPNVLLPELVPFICQSEGFYDYAVKTSAGSLSPRTNWSHLANYEFPLPPLDEQHRIANLLLASNNELESKRNLLISTRKLKNALLEELFSKGVSEYRGKFRNTPVANVPESWNSLIIADVARVVRGSTPRPAGDPRYFNGDFIPWITVGELTKDDLPILSSTATMLTEEGSKKSRLMQKGTVVLSNSGFSLGIPKILGLTGCANDGVAAFLDLSELVEPLFLYYHLFRLTDYMRNVVAAGGDQPNLNTDRIGKIPINLPNLDEQKKIVEILSNCDETIIELNNSIEKSKNLCFQLLRTVLKN